MTRTQPFSRGFLITRADSPAAPPEGWGTLELPGADWVFHHDALVQPELRFTPDGTRWVLTYGMCLVADPDSTTSDAAQYVVDHLAMSQTQFLNALDLLGGRHIVLRGGPDGIALHQDAMGTRSVYFSADEDAVSSHLKLLASQFPFQDRLPSEGRDTVGLLWSRTALHGIEALLPNHSLELGTWSVERFFPRQENQYTGLTLEQKISCFRSIWDRQLQELEATGADLVFSLTGGADSRTALALSWPSRDRFRMFTYALLEPRGNSFFTRAMTKDRRIVDQLLTALPGAKHSYFYADAERQELSPELAEAVDLNTAGSHGRWLIPHYVNNFGSTDAVHMRGSGFEVGRAYWGVTAESDNNAAMKAMAYSRLRKSATAESAESRDQYFADGIRRWGYDQELHGYHRLDLYYWEIRMGRWAAEIHNETDVAFDTWVGMNVRALAEISLSMSLDDRASGRLFAELINDSHPLLNFFGKNDVRNLYEQQRDAELAQAPQAPRAELAAGLHLESGAESAVLPTAEKTLLSIPRDRFAPGARLSRRFEPRAQGGDLRFVLTSRYGREQAAGTFRYQIWLNERLEVSWDGGISAAPVHVTVADLRAGDAVAVSAVPLADRRSVDSWSSASRTWIEDAVFEPKTPRRPRSVAVDAPNATRPDYSAATPRFMPHDLSSLPLSLLPLDEPTRLDVDLGECVLPLLVVRRATTRVLTFFNGAVDLERSKGEPIFQRSTWSSAFPQSLIFVADPGTIGPEALSLSWGQISPEFSAVPGTLHAVRLLAAALGATEPGQRLYFGSSAGGFWAWSAAVLDTGSRAVVNNAQIDWTRWMATGVNAIRAARFGNQTPADLRAWSPERTNVLELWKASGKPASIDYWVNTASRHDAAVDLPQVEAFERAEPQLAAGLRIHRYADEASGHNPMSYDAVVRALTEDLDDDQQQL